MKNKVRLARLTENIISLPHQIRPDTPDAVNSKASPEKSTRKTRKPALLNQRNNPTPCNQQNLYRNVGVLFLVC
jgi:hypothetical protein